MRTAKELSTNMEHKTFSNVSKEITLAEKTTLDQGILLLMKMVPYLKGFNNSHAQADCQQNLVYIVFLHINNLGGSFNIKAIIIEEQEW